MIGTTIRVLLLVAWLGMTGAHIWRRSDLGLSQATDPRATLAARLGKVFHYTITWRSAPTVAPVEVGTCTQSTLTDDVGITLSTRVDLRNTRFLPGERMWRLAIGGLGKAGIKLNFDEALDSGLRLREIAVDGQLFGIPFSAKGPVDHTGLTLTWKAADQEGTSSFPEVRPERIAGGELGSGLPPGLKPGDRFTTRISSIDPARLGMAVKEAVFRVVAQGASATAGGPADLLEVEMTMDGRHFANLWCDTSGTVHRQQLLDFNLELSLRQITDVNNTRLWPAP